MWFKLWITKKYQVNYTKLNITLYYKTQNMKIYNKHMQGFPVMCENESLFKHNYVFLAIKYQLSNTKITIVLKNYQEAENSCISGDA